MEIEPQNPTAVRACLGRRQSLPTLPTTFSKLMSVASNPNANLLELVEIIAYDPILMANVLRVANSSYMGLKEPVEDLSAAILYLGMSEIKRIALSVGSFDLFRSKGVSSDFLRNIWVHSLTTALISQQLANAAQFEFAEEAYLPGLLHDLGKLFFATFYPAIYAPLRLEVSEGRGEGLALETTIFGMTHVDAVVELCEHWKLPPKIATVAKNHHDPCVISTEERMLGLCVALANVLAHQALADEPMENRLPQAEEWMKELAAATKRPEAFGPDTLQAIVHAEAQRARRLEDMTVNAS
jgi:HD-like signal output (HDOD) protein